MGNLAAVPSLDGLGVPSGCNSDCLNSYEVPKILRAVITPYFDGLFLACDWSIFETILIIFLDINTVLFYCYDLQCLINPFQKENI